MTLTLKRLKQAHYRGRRWSPEDGRLLVGWQWEGWVFVHDVGRDHVRTVWPAAWFERLPYAERGGIG